MRLCHHFINLIFDFVSCSKNLASVSSGAANRKSSKLAALTGSAFPNNFFSESSQSKRDLFQEELQMFNVMHRVLEEVDISDQETIHLLVYLLMQFLSWPDAQHPADDKSLNRTQVWLNWWCVD